jgi:autotransporter-associated beta strand protein
VRPRVRFLFSLSLVPALTAPAWSQSVLLWTGSASATWSAGANWTPTGPPGSGDIARFQNDTSRDPSIGGTATLLGSIEFLSGADSETIGGTATLTLGGVAGAGITNSSGLAQNFSPGVALAGTQTWSTSGSGSNLAFNRTVNLGGHALTLVADADTTIAMSTGSGDVISSSVADGSIAKSGGGTVTFGNVANTFDGGFTLNAGTATFANNAAFGTGLLTLNGGTLTSTGTGTRTLANDLRLGGEATIAGAGGRHYIFSTGNISTTGGSLTIAKTTGSGVSSVGFSGADFTFSQPIVLADGTTELRLLNTGGTQTFSGTISGAGALVRDATGGTTVLAGNNTFSGGTVLDAGTIQAEHDHAFGSGTIDFSGGGLASSGDRTFDNAVLVTGASTIAGGAGVRFLFRSNTVSGSGGSLTLDNTDDSGTMRVVFSGAGFTLSRPIAFADAHTQLRFSNASGTQTFSGAITGEGSVLRNDTGETILTSGSNTFTGGLSLLGGTLAAGNNRALGSGTVTLAGGTLRAEGASRTLANAFRLEDDSTLGGSLALTLAGGLTQAGGDHTLAITNTAFTRFTTAALELAENNTARTLTLAVAGTSGGLQIDSPIQDGSGSGADGLVKTGDGTLTLAGTNTYTGATTISGGSVSLQNNAGLGDTAGATTVADGATLALDRSAHGNLVTLAESLTLQGSGFGGEGALRNTLGTNTFSGAITLAGGTLITADAGTALTLGGAVSGGGSTLTLGSSTQTGNITIADTLALGGGTLVKEGAGLFTFSGASGAAGAVQLNAGTFSVGGSSTLATLAIAAATGTTLTIASGGSVTADYASGTTIFSGALAGAGTFQKDGAGTLVFDHSFTATGLTLILNGGTLALADGAQITVGTLRITGDTILDFGGAAGTFLSSVNLIIEPGVTVTVQNWLSVANDSALSTVWYASGTINGSSLGGVDRLGGTPLNQIVFSNYSGFTTTWVSGTHDGWFNHEIRPTPEPATTGACVAAVALGCVFWHRQRNARRPG